MDMPDVIVRLARWLEPELDLGRDERSRTIAVGHALGCESIAELLDARVQAGTRPWRRRELDYDTPVEVVPVMWQGGDALQIALLVRAEEPGVAHPLVAYAPGEDGPTWLGDDAADGLSNLMAVALRDTGRTPPFEGMSAADISEIRAETSAAVVELAGALGLSIPGDTSLFADGIRTDRAPSARIPMGWRFQDTGDGIGVLAPTAAFDPSLRWPPWAEDARALAVHLLERFPASALAVARRFADAAPVMPRALEALGRPFLAARAEDALTRRPRDATR